MKNIEQSLEIEIDNLDEYEYATSFGPSEVKHSETLLVYMIKKNNLSAIEGYLKKIDYLSEISIGIIHSNHYLIMGILKLSPLN